MNCCCNRLVLIHLTLAQIYHDNVSASWWYSQIAKHYWQQIIFFVHVVWQTVACKICSLLQIGSLCTIVSYLDKVLVLTICLHLFLCSTYTGKNPQIFQHNLIALIDKNPHRFHMPSRFGNKLQGIPDKLVPRKFAVSHKVPDTKGCTRCCIGKYASSSYSDIDCHEYIWTYRGLML